MAGKAFRYISAGGKTFFYNINEAKSGLRYITIIARKGGDASTDEKMVFFPNQIGSYLHGLLETYAEVCRLQGIHNYLTAPFMITAEVTSEEGEKKEPVKSRLLKGCPVCKADGTTELMPEIFMHNDGAWVGIVCGCGYTWPEGDAEKGTRGEAELVFDWEWLVEVHKRFTR